MIHVETLTGPAAGMRMAHDLQRLSFGRAPDNHIPLPHPHLSRNHGEIRLDDQGRWTLTTRGANPIQINGRTIRSDKPRTLRPGDTIAIAGTPLFTLHFQWHGHPGETGVSSGTGISSGTGVPPVDAHPSPSPRAPLSSRARLWIALGAFNVLALAVILIAAIIGPASPGPTEAPRLDPELIAAEVRRPLDRPGDDREAARHLTEARERYPRTTAAPDGLYRAHRHYKLAEAYGGPESLEGLDRLRLLELERRLIDHLTTGAADAYNLIRNREWSAAERRLRELTETYPDSASPIFRTLQQQLTHVRQHRPPPRTFR